MNLPCRNPDSVSPLAWLALLVSLVDAVGQPSAELEIQTYAGLTITGEVGKVYSVECVADLTNPAESDWRCVEYLQLPASPYLWVDKSAPATERRFYRASVMEAPANMVFIPPGTFRMGSPEDEEDHQPSESPQTAVIISHGFWMGKFEVTQAEYLDVVGTNSSWFNGDRTDQGWADYGVDLTRPVEQVNWDDAMDYCSVLTEREQVAGRIRPNSAYRLPTEAEWEYACRAGTSTRFSYGEDPGYTNLADYAWYPDNSDGQPHPVGQKQPNPWGLYDMHGNLYEWCQDWYSDHLFGGILLDPQGPETGRGRAIRGGSWSSRNGWDTALSFRSAARSLNLPRYGTPASGFRVVLAPSQP